jgi:hypothetical protein
MSEKRIVLGKFKGFDFAKFVRAVYDLSKPQGLGFLHYSFGTLTDIEVKTIMDLIEDKKVPHDETYDYDQILYLDYVNGRACKCSLCRDSEDNVFVFDDWYDHTNDQLKQLLEKMGIKAEVNGEHCLGCNCKDCRISKGLNPNKDDVTGITFPDNL